MPPFEVKDKNSRVVDLPEGTIHILKKLAAYYEGTKTKSPYIVLDKEQRAKAAAIDDLLRQTDAQR